MIEEEDGAGVDWRAQLVFPGLRAGERLQRETTLAARGAILARDGTPLAKGPDRLSDLGPLAAEVAGRVGPAPPERAASSPAAASPRARRSASTGSSASSTSASSGTPGGILRAGARVVARAEPRAGADVRSAIDPDIQRAAVEALAGRFGGIAVLRPAHGRGARALRHRVLRSPAARLDVQDRHARRRARGEGRQAAREASRSRPRPRSRASSSRTPTARPAAARCEQSFADSCNSVFAPLGAKLGAERLVETAERFGFNQDPGPLGAARSTIPAAEEIGDDLAVGSTAIGQGKVLATPLELATVAATIGLRGRRVAPTLSRGAQGEETRATSARTARVVASFMRAVVKSGTGVGAQVPGVVVAGKTGTAELRSTVNEDPAPLEPGRDARPRSRRRTRPTPTRGSWPSRPTATRASRSRCCSSARARAARRRRRRPRR